jgi:anti-sigma regulatory factor (Ser/Thr protein kinase)
MARWVGCLADAWQGGRAAPALAPLAVGCVMADGGGSGLRHVAFFYRDQAERRAKILSLVRAGLARAEPSLIALPGDEARLLGDELGDEPGELLCCDIADVGRNPARLIPEYRSFIDKHAGQRVLLVGEVAWPGRSPAEIREATRHEALVNLAFSEARATMMCAYDVSRLAPSAVGDARCTHPEHLEDLTGGELVTTASHAPAFQIPAGCDRPLPPPPAGAETLAYDTDLAPVRRLVESHTRRTALGADRAADLILAASEVAANTLGHARSGGTVQVWHDGQEIVCQAQDQGWITDPLAGRVRRGPDGRGHGLYLVNHVCDLVELRTGPAGTTIRMHMRLPRTA